jgi:hypothetical protein
MKRIILLILFVLLPSVSIAEEMSGVSFYEISSGGIRKGCNLVFSAVLRDNSAKLISVRGSLGFMENFWTFKLEHGDAQKWMNLIKEGRQNQVRSDPVHYAFFKPVGCKDKGCDISSAGREIRSFKSEGGGFFGVYDLVDDVAVASNLGITNIQIGFNRKKSDYDTKFEIDMKDNNNLVETKKYFDCVGGFVKE